MSCEEKLRKVLLIWGKVEFKPSGINLCSSLTMMDGLGVLNPCDPLSANESAIKDGI